MRCDPAAGRQRPIPSNDARRPTALNSRLGHYTKFANLLGLAATAVPGGFTSSGLPFGVTLVGPSQADEALGRFADAIHRVANWGAGRSRSVSDSIVAAASNRDMVELAVVGAHLSGLPLNENLLVLGGRLLRETQTAGDYRLYALPNADPAKPGLVREPGFSRPGVPVEVWWLAAAAFGRFVAGIPQPLGIG